MTLRPRGVALPATQEDVHADTRRRVLALEQRTREAAATTRFCVTAVTLPGTTTNNGAVTSRWYPYWSAVNLDYLFVSLTGSLLDPLDVDVLVNNVTVGTASVPAGDLTGRVAVAATLRPFDFLTFGIPLTSGVSGLTAQAWFSGPLAGCTGGLLFDVGSVG